MVVGLDHINTLAGCPSPPLSEEEIAAWITAMGQSDLERYKNIRELLSYGRSDGMSFYDMAICRKLIVEWPK